MLGGLWKVDIVQRHNILILVRLTVFLATSQSTAQLNIATLRACLNLISPVKVRLRHWSSRDSVVKPAQLPEYTLWFLLGSIPLPPSNPPAVTCTMPTVSNGQLLCNSTGTAMSTDQCWVGGALKCCVWRNLTICSPPPLTTPSWNVTSTMKSWPQPPTHAARTEASMPPSLVTVWGLLREIKQVRY